MSALVGEIKARLSIDDKAWDSGLSKAERRLGGFEGRVKSAGQSTARVGKSMMLRVTAPIVGVGVAAGVMARDFNESMTRVHALTDASKQQVEAWEPTVKSLAQTYAKTGKEAADALYYISSAGLQGADAIDALEMSLKASAVGLGEVETVADLATSAMNAWKNENLTAAEAGDILAATVNAGKLNSAELAGAMGSAIPIANKMGVQFHELGAAFAAMSRTGTGAREASTQVQGILTTLLAPTKATEEALSDLGLSSKMLRKSIRDDGLLATLEILRTKFGDNETAAARVFRNKRALKGVNDLLNSTEQELAEMFNKTAQSAGDLDKAMEATADTAEFATRQAFADLKAQMLEVGQVVVPIFADVMKTVAGLVKRFGDLPSPVQKAVVGFAAAAAALGPVLFLGGKLIVAFGALAGAAGRAGFALIAMRRTGNILQWLQGVGVLGRIAAASLWAIARAGASGLWGALVGGIRAVGAAVMFLGRSIMKHPLLALLSVVALLAIPLFMELAEVLKGPLMQVFEALKPVMNIFGEMISELASALAPTFAVLADVFRQVMAALAPLTEAFGVFVAASVGPLVALLPLLTPMIELLARVLGGVLVGAIGAALIVWGTLVGGLSRSTGVILGSVIRPITDGFLSMAEIIVGAAATAFGWVPGIGPKLQNAATSIGSFKEAVTGAMHEAATTISQKGSAMGRELVTAGQVAGVEAGKVWRGETKKAGAEAGKGAGEGIKSASGLIKGEGTKLGEMLGQGVKSGRGRLRGEGKAAGEAVANGVRNSAPQGRAAGQHVGASIGDGVVAGLRARQDAAYQAGLAVGQAGARGARDGAKVKSPSRLTIPVGRGIADGIAVGIQSRSAAVQSAASRFTARLIADMGSDSVKAVAAERKRVMDEARRRSLAEDKMNAKMTKWSEARRRKHRAREAAKTAAQEWARERRAAAERARQIQVDAAREALDAAKARAQAVLDRHADLATGLRDFGSITQTPMAAGVGTTAEVIIGSLNARLAAIKKFGSYMNDLEAAGLNKAILSEVWGMGPVAGSQIAQALLSEAGSVGSVNRISADIGKWSDLFAGDQTRRETGRTVSQAQSVIDASVTVAAGGIVVNLPANMHATDRKWITDEVKKGIQAGLKELANTVAKAKK